MKASMKCPVVQFLRSLHKVLCRTNFIGYLEAERSLLHFLLIVMTALSISYIFVQADLMLKRKLALLSLQFAYQRKKFLFQYPEFRQIHLRSWDIGFNQSE